MKTLTKVLLILLALIAVTLLVALFLPGTYHVERSITIQAKPEAIFPWINDLRKWPEWTAWNKEKDPTVVYSYEGPTEGAGAISKWNGEKFGEGSMKITTSDPQKGAQYDLSFDHGKYNSKGGLTFETVGDNTRVIWSDDGELGRNPINRFFGLMMDKMIGPDFEEGLNKLKQKVEQK